MRKSKRLIEVSTATHAVLKRHASRLGMTIDEVIGAALETFDRRSDDDKQKSAAVWRACRAFWQGMNETKK